MGPREVIRPRAARLALTGALLAAAVLLALPAGGLAKPGQGAQGQRLSGLYNTRYCEIFTVEVPEPGTFEVSVFNTVGLSLCPPDQWRAVDYDEVKASQGAVAAVPNGPRRWVLDAISGAEASDPLVIGGMDMRKVGVLTLSTLQPPPFTEMTIDRTTEWNFRKGRTLHVLISPTGARYAMQAYTTNVDPTLRARNLDRIATNPLMQLPEGWTYRNKKLRKRLVLRTDGATTILRDGLASTYQRFTWPKSR